MSSINEVLNFKVPIPQTVFRRDNKQPVQNGSTNISTVSNRGFENASNYGRFFNNYCQNPDTNKRSQWEDDQSSRCGGFALPRAPRRQPAPPSRTGLFQLHSTANESSFPLPPFGNSLMTPSLTHPSFIGNARPRVPSEMEPWSHWSSSMSQYSRKAESIRSNATTADSVFRIVEKAMGYYMNSSQSRGTDPRLVS